MQNQSEDLSVSMLKNLSSVLFQTFLNRQHAESYCLSSIIDTISVVIRRGLLQDSSMEQFPSVVMQTVRDGNCSEVPSSVWKLFAALVAEVDRKSSPIHTRLSQQIAQRFRDGALLFIFQCACRELQRLSTSSQISQDALRSVVQLISVVLSFDFLCTSDDETDAQTVELPTEWRNSVLFCSESLTTMDGNIVDILWSLVRHNFFPTITEPLFSSLAQISSVRRSFFQSDNERQWCLNRLLSGTLDAMNRINWETVSELGYAEFCRLLKRVKPNFQLNELLTSTHYNSWIHRVAEFTCGAFVQGSPTGHLSLVALWSSLLTSSSFARRDRETFFAVLAPRVALSYIRSRIQLSDAWAARRGGRESLFDDDSDELILQMDFMGSVLRFAMPFILDEFGRIFRPLRLGYTEQLQRCPTVFDPALEEKLAWMVALLGGLLSSALTVAEEGELFVDGLFAQSVLDLLPFISERVRRSQGSMMESAVHLEQASLYFLHCFRKKILGETTPYANRVLRQLLEETNLRNDRATTTEQQTALVEIVMQKIIHNLGHWLGWHRIVDGTLQLLSDIAQSLFAVFRQLSLGSAATYHLLWRPEEAGIPFMVTASVGHRYRVRFRATLSSILFLDPNLNATKFRDYVSGVLGVLEEVRRLTEGTSVHSDAFSSAAAREHVLGMACDLRGILMSCLNKRTYGFMSELLLPHFLNALSALQKQFLHDSVVLTQLLRLAGEMAFNRCQRIQFDQHAAEGFHLFFFAARTVQFMSCAIVEAVQQEVHDSNVSRIGLLDVASDSWKTSSSVVKNTALVFHIAKCGLSGGYCNFGVLKLYGDDCLSSMLKQVWGLMVVVCSTRALQYPKLTRDLIALTEQIFSVHFDFVAIVPAEELVALLRLLEYAIGISRITNMAATALGVFFKQLVDPLPGVRPDSQLVTQMLLEKTDPLFVDRVVLAVFDGPITDDSVHTWNVAQLLLPLLLVASRSARFHSTRQAVVDLYKSRYQRATATTSNMEGALDRLLNCEDLTNMDRAAKDSLQQRVTQFRLAVKGNS